MEKLAILGGPKAVRTNPGQIFDWPIITPEVEDAVLEVLRAGKMSGRDITIEFEQEFAAWLGTKYVLGHNNGTAALHAAMFGLGIGQGDEIICPSMTYWASCLPVFSLGGTVVFADIDAETLCIDPEDIERHISDRTKAIVVVHYGGYPADMDRIMELAGRYGVKVIEDCSHSHGSLYKGRMTGTISEVSAFSLMTQKSMPIGEGGTLCTNDQRIFERALAFGHYARHKTELQLEDLKAGAGLPWGGYKYRMHQLSSAMGRVQLKDYPERMAEIDRAMNYFWDLLEGVPGIRPMRPPRDSGSTMGGWYAAHGRFLPEELDGVSVARFCAAVNAEGISECSPGCNFALHLHPLLNEIDVYHEGKPTRISRTSRDVRQARGSLPVAESIQERVFSIPWFKHYRSDIIEEYAAAFRKVAENTGQIPA